MVPARIRERLVDMDHLRGRNRLETRVPIAVENGADRIDTRILFDHSELSMIADVSSSGDFQFCCSE